MDQDQPRHRGRPKKLTPDQEAEMRDRCQTSPIDQAELAAEFGVSVRTVKRTVADYPKLPEFRRMPNAKLSWPRVQKMRQLCADGYINDRQAAGQFGVSRS